MTNSDALLYFEFCLKKCIVLNVNQYKFQSNKKISQNEKKVEIGTVFGVAFLLVQIAKMAGSEIDLYVLGQTSYFGSIFAKEIRLGSYLFGEIQS